MLEPDWKFRILEGLPATGDLPTQFSATGIGMHSEGLVAKFWSESSDESWIGNFQRGLNLFDQAVQHPNLVDIIIVAGGDVYVVNPERRTLQDNFGGDFETITAVPDQSLFIFGTSIDFVAVGSKGRAWRSARIALDGIRSMKLENGMLTGEAYTLEDQWTPFSLDVASGEFTGGADIWW